MMTNSKTIRTPQLWTTPHVKYLFDWITSDTHPTSTELRIVLPVFWSNWPKSHFDLQLLRRPTFRRQMVTPTAASGCVPPWCPRSRSGPAGPGGRPLVGVCRRTSGVGGRDAGWRWSAGSPARSAFPSGCHPGNHGTHVLIPRPSWNCVCVYVCETHLDHIRRTESEFGGHNLAIYQDASLPEPGGIFSPGDDIQEPVCQGNVGK